MPHHTPQRTFLYIISRLLFQWSLIYLLVLFFLEDIKPFIVTDFFSPHWLFVSLLAGIGGIVVYSDAHHDPSRQSPPSLSLLDRMVLYFVAAFVALLWFDFFRSVLGIWAFAGAAAGAAAVAYFSLRLTLDKKKEPSPHEVFYS